MLIDINRVIAQAAARRISQKNTEFKPILVNAEFPLEQNSAEELFLANCFEIHLPVVYTRMLYIIYHLVLTQASFHRYTW